MSKPRLSLARGSYDISNTNPSSSRPDGSGRARPLILVNNDDADNSLQVGLLLSTKSDGALLKALKGLFPKQRAEFLRYNAETALRFGTMNLPLATSHDCGVADTTHRMYVSICISPKVYPHLHAELKPLSSKRRADQLRKLADYGIRMCHKFDGAEA